METNKNKTIIKMVNTKLKILTFALTLFTTVLLILLIFNYSSKYTLYYILFSMQSLQMAIILFFSIKNRITVFIESKQIVLFRYKKTCLNIDEILSININNAGLIIFSLKNGKIFKFNHYVAFRKKISAKRTEEIVNLLNTFIKNENTFKADDISKGE